MTGVPAEIRAVPRPKNTVVINRGGNGAHCFPVYARKSVNYVKDHNPSPRNGTLLGHIYDFKFVPLGRPLTSVNEPAIREWGLAAFMRSVSDDIIEDLCKCYELKEAHTILVMAMLRLIRRSIPASRFSVYYRKTFLSVFYPGLALSENTVCKLLRNIGTDDEKRHDFAKLRLKRVLPGHSIAIDGTLKTNNSIVNNLSDWSHKSRVRGEKDIFVLYAYDVQLMEPIFCDVVGGNTLDAKALLRFIDRNHLKEGIIVTDKGFQLNEIESYLTKHPMLHFLLPIKRNNKLIEQYEMTSGYQKALEGQYAGVLGKKVKMEDGRFLYSFSDPDRAWAEDKAMRCQLSLHQEEDLEQYEAKHKLFGVIVFISDLDLDLNTVYKRYDERWILESTFALFKGDLGLFTTAVQDEYSVRGREFVNYIGTIIASRLRNEADKAGLLDKMTFGNLLEDLSDADRRSNAPPSIKPVRYDPYWEFELESVYDEMEVLGLIDPVPSTEPPAPKKRGRPRKEASKQEATAKAELEKRGRGRPRKNPQQDPGSKRPRGRPRKSPPKDPNAPKRPRGRPRKDLEANKVGS